MSTRQTIQSLILLLFLLMYVPLSGALKDKVNSITGGVHTRMVWLKGGAERMTGGGDMWGFDSKTGEIRKLFSGSSQLFYRPIICAGGHKIVVTTAKDCKVYIYNWDGTGKRYLARGICSDVFKDPFTGKEHVIVHTRTDGSDFRVGSGIIKRYSIDDPSQVMTLFDKWSIKGEPWYSVSGDGKMGAAFLPWNQVYYVANGGIAKNGAHMALSQGCWTSVTSDNSYYWFHLGYVDGHDRVHMYRGKTLVSDNVNIFPGSVPVNTISTEMYHPKFASKGARYYVQTAGYTRNRGASTAEVYFGKFSADYKTLGTCVRMTGDNTTDYWPDAWVGVEAVTEPEPEPEPDTFPRKFNFGDDLLNGWESANGYVTGGRNVSTTDNISTAGVSNAAPAALYQTCTHQGFDFALSVPNGSYTLRCHTVEYYYTSLAEAAANRAMDITVEGKVVEEDLNPSAKAGALDKAVVLEYPVTVSDGTLNLSVKGDGSDAYLMGLEVLKATTSISDDRFEIIDLRFTTSDKLYDMYGRQVDKTSASAGVYLIRNADGMKKIVIGR